MESAVIGCLAFLAMTLVGLGLFGRPDQSRPTCARCGADARPFAWDAPPRCSCGAGLDRPGAVRTRGRIRRPRAIVAGVVLLVLAAPAMAWLVGLEQKRLRWFDGLPLAVRAYGLERGDAWAIESAYRRQARAVATASEAAALIEAADRGVQLDRLAPPDPRSYLIESLLQAHLDDASIADRTFPIASALAMSARAVPCYTTEDGTVRVAAGASVEVNVTLRVLPGGLDATQFIARIERITLNGRDVEWVGECLDRSPTRVVLMRGTVKVTIPSGTPAGRAELVVDLFLARASGASAVVCDELIDGTAPPSEWGINAMAVPLRRTFPIEVTGAAP